MPECAFASGHPGRTKVEVVVEGSVSGSSGRETEVLALSPEEGGYFAGVVTSAGAGTLYRYRLDGKSYPDVASRFQPAGPLGPSLVVDPVAFEWTDSRWGGVPLAGQVVYEMHIGTFTREGTWTAAAQELSELADLGITLIEVMPVAEFPVASAGATTASISCALSCLWLA